MTYEIDLTGHRALVTGAGQGVGEEIARTLAQAGAEVLVNDLVLERAQRVVDGIAADGGEARAAVFDVTDYGAVVAAVDDGGPVDILVNNAGNAGRATTMGAEDLATLVESDPADWEGFIRVNLYGVMYAVRAALPGMIEGGWGRVVTVISDTARVGETHMPAYSAAKAGAAGFCRSVAREVGRHGITVNCVALGTMNTQGIPPEDDEIGKQIVKRYVIRRRGLPSDIAAMCTFLASPQAEWITGQTYPVNGGYSFSL
jgi:NAD(P)-dependent dehydrogenase (short-subunit alcohol dehydrogenase family)